MAQSLAGVTIHCDDGGLVYMGESNYTFQEVLDATSETISYFGAKSRRATLTFKMFEDENSNTGDATLEAARKANANVNLTLNDGSKGNWRILTYRATQKQNLRMTNPSWECAVELVSAS